jgi:2-polyprenyl-3-methyl-5-hydroxy-6-metoxy-1,4-benzoquinol methylase
MNIKSPITNTYNTSLVKSLSAQSIIDDYEHHLGVDTRRFFAKISTVNVYRCNDTGYQFFTPFEIAGDEKFYQALQKFDWYYMPWKWEHKQVAKLISSGSKVLEVGCGEGGFLKRITEDISITATGLELNNGAIEKARQGNVNAVEETVQNHSKKYFEYYDVVCSFQVLEHITEVSSFLKGNIDCLKKKGKLFISVPNNSSFLKSIGVALNLPPHHMGLWDDVSIKSIENYYSVKYIDLFVEPLQEYHQFEFDTFLNKKFLNLKSTMWYKIAMKVSPVFLEWRINKLLLAIVKYLTPRIGHSIVACFEKV